MEFEYDSDKSLINKGKHGIDFEDAKELWNDSDAIVFPAKGLDEKRFLIIGLIKNKSWSVIFTWRSEKIRIISVKRSRKTEIAQYESHRIR